MKLVIRVSDECGSFFCGFAKNFSGIVLSSYKINALVYEAEGREIKYDMAKIIQCSGGELTCSAQEYENAPDEL